MASGKIYHKNCKSGIYVILNLVNNKIYIGSAKKLSQRKCDHFRNLKLNKHINYHLQRSFNKHGIENFTFQCLEYCEISNLIEREQYYIDNLNPEYNICREARSVLGRKHKPETIEKIRKANTGYKASEETRKKQSLAKRGLYKYKSSNIILQYDLNGNLIKKWFNGAGHIADTLASYGIKRSGISMCLKNKLKTYKKYIWKYEKSI